MQNNGPSGGSKEMEANVLWNRIEEEEKFIIEHGYKLLDWSYLKREKFFKKCNYYPKWTKSGEVFSNCMVLFELDREPLFKHHLDLIPEKLNKSNSRK